MKKLITVFGKFEEYISKETGRGLLKAEHETLNEEFGDTLRNTINDPRKGMLKKVRDLQRKV